MKVIIDTEERIAELAAQRYVQLLNDKPEAILGYATGSTPLGLYAELIRLNKAGKFSYAKATSFNLDEYAGLDGSHDQSYRYFMNHNLFDHVDIRKDHTFVPSGLDLSAETAAAYDKAIEEAGGIDLQLLGIGRDGHIGFNEPLSSLSSRTRAKSLTPETYEQNGPLFDKPEDMPMRAFTMGVGTILDARRLVLLATGAEKAEIFDPFDRLRGPKMPCNKLFIYSSCTHGTPFVVIMVKPGICKVS